MRLSSLVILCATFIAPAILNVVAAGLAVNVIEAESRNNVKKTLDKEEFIWSEVYAEGLQIFITGTDGVDAPSTNGIAMCHGGYIATTKRKGSIHG